MTFMAKHKSGEKKEFLIAVRKRTGASITNAPVWIMQKAKKRIYNTKGNRHWRRTNFGTQFERTQKEQGKVKMKIKRGKKYRKGARAKLKRKKKR